MSRIIGYTYEADVHCVDCAVKRFGRSLIESKDLINHGGGVTQILSDDSEIELDVNLIDLDQEDREGNKVHPIFSTDELEISPCGDCREVIE